MTLIVAIAFVFGTIIGSFLNVVALRYNTGLSITRDRSRCFSCGKTLTWYELIPVVSFIIQGGKCRKCGSSFSWQYPAVELFTGLLFASLAFIYPPITVSLLIKDLILAAIWSILIVIVIYDLRHKIIPDGLAFLFAVLSLAHLFIGITNNQLVIQIPAPLDLAAGPILFIPFFLLWFISRGAWMGLGDAKLAVGIGWFLGLVYGVSAIILAFWIGAAVGIILLVLQKITKHSVFHRFALSWGLGERIMKSEIPFAPFLVVGMLIIFFYHLDIVGLSLFF